MFKVVHLLRDTPWENNALKLLPGSISSENEQKPTDQKPRLLISYCQFVNDTGWCRCNPVGGGCVWHRNRWYDLIWCCVCMAWTIWKSWRSRQGGCIAIKMRWMGWCCWVNRVGEDGVRMRMCWWIMHAHVPIRLTLHVSMGHGGRRMTPGGWDRSEEGKVVKPWRIVIYIWMAAGEGRSGPLGPGRTIKDDQAEEKLDCRRDLARAWGSDLNLLRYANDMFLSPYSRVPTVSLLRWACRWPSATFLLLLSYYYNQFTFGLFRTCGVSRKHVQSWA